MQSVNPKEVPQRKLANGESLPVIGMGTFGSDQYSPEQIAAAVEGGIRSGYRLIDCASVYGNEAEIGDAIARSIAHGAVAREEIFVISKLWNDMHGPGDALLSLAQSLKDLQLDYLDGYFVHWPFPNYHAPGCDGDSRNPDSRPFILDEFMGVWRQMERLHDMGLVRHLGMSNMTLAKMKLVLPECRIAPSLIEMELHPAFQQSKLFDYCIERNIQPVGYSPLGSPSRPERDRTTEDIAATQIPVIQQIASAHGIHPVSVCLKWAAQRGQIPIPFSVKPEQYISNLHSVTQDPLTAEEMAQIADADADCRLIKGQVFLWPGAGDWRALWDEDGTIAGW